MTKRLLTILTAAIYLASTAHAALGANPRYIEEAAIGGGYSDTVDGGIDLEKDGDFSAQGDGIFDGTLTVGGIFNPNGDQITGDGSRLDIKGATTVRIEENTLDVYDADGATSLDITAGGSFAALTISGYRASSSPIGTNNQNYAARGTLSSPSVVPGNTILHRQTFYGYDSNSQAPMARIDVRTANLTLGDGDMPGEFQFMVSPDGSETPAVALTIASTTAITTAADFTAGDDAIITDQIQGVTDVELLPASTYKVIMYEDGGAVAASIETDGKLSSVFGVYPTVNASVDSGASSFRWNNVYGVALNSSGNSTFGDASTDTNTFTGRLLVRQVTDAGPMTATGGTEGEVVYNLSNDKYYGCTVTHATAATWSIFN